MKPSQFLKIGGILAVGLPVALAGLWFTRQFDGLYGQDPYAYYEYATGPVLESLKTAQPLPPFFWPPGYPLLVGLFASLGGISPRVGQLVSLLAGVAVPFFTALLAAKLWQRTDERWLIAVLSGALVAMVGQLWQSSVVVMADTLGLAAATAGMWALSHYDTLPDDQPAPAASGKSREGLWLAVAAGCLAYALLTRWAYGLVCVPAALYVLYRMWHRPVSTGVRHAVGAAIVVLVVMAPLWWSWVSDAREMVDQGAFVGDWQVYSWSPVNAFQRQFQTTDGLLSYRFPNGLYYAIAPAHRYYFTPILAFFILPGIFFTARRPGAFAITALVGWPLVIYLFHAGAPWQNFRFTLAYLPPLAILSAAGTVGLGLRSSRPLRLALAGVVLAGLALMGAGGWRLTSSQIERAWMDREVVHWAESRMAPGAQLLTFGITKTAQHESDHQVYEIYHLDPGQLDELVNTGRPTYLLLHLPGIISQWEGLPSYENFIWLRDGPGLVELGEKNGYTLFEVKGALILEALLRMDSEGARSVASASGVEPPPGYPAP